MKWGETALMYAAEAGETKIVSLLIDNGADVFARDNDGDDALQWAKDANQTAVMKLLKAAGAGNAPGERARGAESRH